MSTPETFKCLAVVLAYGQQEEMKNGYPKRHQTVPFVDLFAAPAQVVPVPATSSMQAASSLGTPQSTQPEPQAMSIDSGTSSAPTPAADPNDTPLKDLITKSPTARSQEAVWRRHYRSKGISGVIGYSSIEGEAWQWRPFSSHKHARSGKTNNQ
ncbi:unnamed protein product [Miscanthus lutarioriparius]|uniref:Uncharacterized protein n=1 Tax=Miscanthus lutarioriparius TaxID=422564 RepID=A0A811RHK2_9POAL|nr:unnamed protein product [Miscanthus lutarioriparius]